jgi:uncharacterized protein YjiS (DUF1127 family)
MAFLRSATTSARLPGRSAHPTRLLARLRLALAARAQRRALAQADDRLLDDIGVSRDQALAEARRPVWDVPPTWLR